MSRRKTEAAARLIAQFARGVGPKGSAFCVLMWGPDEAGQQWFTYVNNVAPAGSAAEDTGTCRRHLAAELRKAADVIESRADVPPGVAGHG